MKLGKTILAIREEKEMTQQEFADIFSVTRQTVSNWENEKSYPDLQTLVKMSDSFGIPLDSMLKDDADMVKKIDKERKFSKYLKRGLLIFAVLLLVPSVIWTIIWHDAVQSVEEKFQQGIAEYGFSYVEDGWEEEEGNWYPYKLDDGGGVTFSVTALITSDWYNFGQPVAYNQNLICDVQREDGLLRISWYGVEALMPTINIYEKTGIRYLTEQETKKMLRDDEQLKEINEKAKRICKALYEEERW
ncbi:MAG: helix-turn-helix domain-containing protein [Bacteroidales bacterium]|nr:helix-turn-helix domain-containing protein [Clostridium sp.]MCM1204517.1 helix-turn-helix domain-containing protein [Bacteroidales bacterium]